eukprot:178033-Alexandrium_andersonii.AAC.1
MGHEVPRPGRCGIDRPQRGLRRRPGHQRPLALLARSRDGPRPVRGDVALPPAPRRAPPPQP